MKLSTFLVYKTILPFAVVGSVFLSVFLFKALRASSLLPLAFLPGTLGVMLLFWFFYTFGYCPNCRRHMGKNIGRQCRHCGYIYSREDSVSRKSEQGG